MSALDALHYTIPPLLEYVAPERRERIQRRIDSRIKPVGALGRLEPLALQLISLLGDHHDAPFTAELMLCAGDHGVSQKGVSIATSDVTHQMVSQMLAGSASVNVFCRQVGMPVTVIDCGICYELPEHPNLVKYRLGHGTASIDDAPAMSEETLKRALDNARQLVRSRIESGTNLFAVGEMGIGNTTPASALMAALTGWPVEACVGDGTGINSEQRNNKVALIERALARHHAVCDDPLRALAALGGFEIATVVGILLAAAEAGCPIVIDGFVTSVAALVACRYQPACRDYLIFSHLTAEKGHAALYEALNASPLMCLEMRIGEGSGAALAMPLLRAALGFYHEMGGFDEGKVQV